MTADEIASILERGGCVYARGDGSDGIVAIGEGEQAARVLRGVRDEHVGQGMRDALESACELGRERVEITDALKVVYCTTTLEVSSVSGARAVRELAAELARDPSCRTDLGRVSDYLDAVRHLRAFECREHGRDDDPEQDPFEYLHGRRAHLANLPLAYTELDNPVTGEPQQFEVQVTADLVAATLTTEISHFEPVVESYPDLAALDRVGLSCLDHDGAFDALTGWDTEIFDSLVEGTGPLKLADPSERGELCGQAVEGDRR